MSQVFDLLCLMKKVKVPWDVRLSATIGDTLVGCRCNNIFSIMCRSGIIFCAFLKVPPVSASAEEETTFFRVLRSVKIVKFVVGVPLE